MDYQVPPEWAAYGARFGRDGLLYFSEWRRGFTVHEARALFFECQQVRALRNSVRILTSELARRTAESEEAERRAWWYRRQLVLESRLGLALVRLDP